MVKSVLGVSRQGLHDWIIQRLTAIYMAVYSLGLLVYVFRHYPLDYLSWHAVFAQTWLKIGTIFFIAAILSHAWIGIWTIVTDYIKPFILRALVHVGVLLALFACFFWALLILWSV